MVDLRQPRRGRSTLALIGLIAALVGSTMATSSAAAHDPTNPQATGKTPEPARPLPQAPGAAVAAVANVLFYGPTAGGLAGSTPGIQATVWDESVWSTKSTADFAAFDAIVFGDQPICFEDSSIWATAVATRQIWSPAISGNVIINGTDPDFHGKTQLVQQSVEFATADPAPGPGLYVSLSCAYWFQASAVPIELLGGIGQFSIRGVVNCPNDVHKVADHPTLAGIDDVYLSNWSCSTHEVFDVWPADFQPLAIIQDATPAEPGVPFHAADGEVGLVYIIARGAAAICNTTNDSDADCIPNDVEISIGTDPLNPDTDGDGLKDSWEVGPGIPGSGFHLPGNPTVARDQVFQPYSKADRGQCAGMVGLDRRIPDQFGCLNHEPNPRHKDVFLEIDWQDCSKGPSCAELFGANLDPLHHAPSIAGLADLADMFSQAPVTNPDGTTGVNLNILVDERIDHHPNCDQNLSRVRGDHFGTKDQRDPATRAARELAVRYVWSGHSSLKEDSEDCTTPHLILFGLQGIFQLPLPDYDHSPFGDANIGGWDILLTLGPLWICQSTSQLNPNPNTFSGPCFRQTIIVPGDPVAGTPAMPVIMPGIFPATVPIFGTNRERVAPVHSLIGEREADAVRQLWSRSLAHLLGHSLGLVDNAAVGNFPSPAGRHQNANHAPLTPKAPDLYTTWNGLRYAPVDGGQSLARDDTEFPNYDALATQDLAQSDPDNDGVKEASDNCRGVWNPGQENTDFANWWAPSGVLEFGDACDDDIDGDGLPNPLPGQGESAVARGSTQAAGATTTAFDPYPYDTDNDGIDNVNDPDDDGDGVADSTDRCPLAADASQSDRDGDGIGDACDLDLDGDGLENGFEIQFGSDALNPARTVEYVGLGIVCSDGIDNDGDGLTDGLDGGCQDTDGDTVADPHDNCPTVSNLTQLDADGDGAGDECDLLVQIVDGTAQILGIGQQGARVHWSATRAGQFSVRLGGSDCLSGTQIDSGAYDPGTFDPLTGGEPNAALAIVQPTELVEGSNTIRVCLTAGAESASDEAVLVVDTTAPAAPGASLDPASDSGVSNTDRITNRAPRIVGTSEANALVTLLADGAPVGQAVAAADGSWGVVDNSAGERVRSYTATAMDAAGNRSAAGAPLAVRFDSLAPSSTATAVVPTGVSYSSADSGSGVALVELWYRFRASSTGAWGAWTMGGSGSASPIAFGFGPGDGFYEFYTVATDVAGNVEAAPVAADLAYQRSSSAWPPSVRVNDDAGTTQQDRPSIAVSSNGTAYLIWDDYRPGTQADIYFAKRDPTSGLWGPNQRVNDDMSGRTQWNADIAVDASSNGYAVWQDDRNGNKCCNTDIYFAKRSAASGAWGVNVRVNNDNQGTPIQANPTIAVASNGAAVAVWVDFRSSEQNLYSARLAAGASTWGPNIRVTPTKGGYGQPDLAIGPDGTAHLVWRSGSLVYYSKLLATGSVWSAPVRVSDQSARFARESAPNIAVDASGNLLAAWADSPIESPIPAVRVARRAAAGTTWGPSSSIGGTGADPVDVALGEATDGRAFVAWQDARSTSYDIWGAEYRPSTGMWSAPELVSDDPASTAQLNPGVAAGSGKIFVTWRDDRTGNPDIRARVRAAN